jgi:hypothetical protein
MQGGGKLSLEQIRALLKESQEVRFAGSLVSCKMSLKEGSNRLPGCWRARPENAGSRTGGVRDESGTESGTDREGLRACRNKSHPLS